MDTNSTDSKKRLCEAISKLEAYSQQQIDLGKPSSVSKTISLVRTILANHFDPKPKNEILTAVEWINRNRIFIEKLREGTPAEQELAEKFTHAINTYNDHCDKRIQGCVTGSQRLAHFFFRDKQNKRELPKISLLKKITVQRHYPEHLVPTPSQQLHPGIEPAVQVSKQSTELFHMKAIALLERHGIASNFEARAFVKKSPIHTTVGENKSICTMTQTLSLFPGQTIVVMGNSAMHPATRAISQLFPESFCLSLESTQTGFPHPIQRAGWTLGTQLLPDAPQRIDLLDQTGGLFLLRNQAVADLLQQGAMFRNAKEWLSLRKKCFGEHAKELIEMQKDLILAILQAASADAASHVIIEGFFQSLDSHATPIDALADASQMMREYFTMRPHQVLLDAIIKGKSTELGSVVPEVRYAAAKKILDEAVDQIKSEFRHQKNDTKLPSEQVKLDYVECLGEILGEASKKIFLQYLSEDLVFTPPGLSSFECKVQTAAYFHLKDFLAGELSATLEGDYTQKLKLVYQHLKEQISSDIAIFKDDSQSSISNELAGYFQRRYLSLSTL